MTAAAAQNEKTIQFWDDYYTSSSAAETGDNNTSNNKEWILHPSLAVFETLYEKLPPASSVNSNNYSNNAVRILEVGCGTSTLSRDFWLYCRSKKGRTDISICATDVSQVCIQQNQERDRELLLVGMDEGCLEYKLLNITTPMAIQENDTREEETNESHSASNSDTECPRFLPQSFDMILDEGCLDTFLFRSRSRGEHKDTLIRTVLNNIHSLLKDPSDSCSSGGVYTIQTPRAKFRPVKEYPGFARVDRTRLDETKGILVPTASPEVKQNGELKRENLYLYSCYKGDFSAQQSIAAVSLVTPLIADTDACIKCGITFLDCRKGEDLSGRGVKFWTRMFRGHCRHCQGNTASSA